MCFRGIYFAFVSIIFFIRCWNCPDWVFVFHFNENDLLFRGRRGHDHMVVGFTTTNAISAYNHWCYGFKSRSGQGIQHYGLCDNVCQWFATCLCFSLGPLVSSINQNWPPRYNWNIVESGVKHHQTIFYLGQKSESPDTILEGGHPRTIPPKFGLNWPSGFWGED